jgi:hypothetical protein
VEYRVVKNVTYDVSKPPFISVTIPAGSALKTSVHYAPNQTPDAPIILKEAVFQIPAIYNLSRPVDMTVFDFPYTPLHFKPGTWQTGTHRNPESGVINQQIPTLVNGIVTKEPISLRLFLAHPATTNYDAMGAMKIIPAKPEFIYGTPVKPVQ